METFLHFSASMFSLAPLQLSPTQSFIIFLKEGVEEVPLEVAEVAIQGEAAGVAGEAVWVATVTWVAQWEVGEAA